MSSMRIPLGLATTSVAGLVLALVASGPIGAVGVALATAPLAVLVRTFIIDARHRKAIADPASDSDGPG